jgi:hypothetical protein
VSCAVGSRNVEKIGIDAKMRAPGEMIMYLCYVTDGCDVQEWNTMLMIQLVL